MIILLYVIFLPPPLSLFLSSNFHWMKRLVDPAILTSRISYSHPNAVRFAFERREVSMAARNYRTSIQCVSTKCSIPWFFFRCYLCTPLLWRLENRQLILVFLSNAFPSLSNVLCVARYFATVHCKSLIVENLLRNFLLDQFVTEKVYLTAT